MKTVLYVILFMLGLGFYFEFPLIIKIILTIINFATEDPIPVVDELLMVIGWFSKMKAVEKTLKFWDWFHSKWTAHKWFRVLSVISIILLVYMAINIFISMW